MKFSWLLVTILGMAQAATVNVHWCISEIAPVPEPVLQGALREAHAVLRKAGVNVAWQRCVPGEPGRSVRIYAVEYLPAHRDAWGVALPEALRAYIFSHPTEQKANGNYSKWIVLLGHVIAHEAGHLAGLQHAPEGIMRALWSSEDLFKASQGQFNFTEVQAATLRAWAAGIEQGYAAVLPPPDGSESASPFTGRP